MSARDWTAGSPRAITLRSMAALGVVACALGCGDNLSDWTGGSAYYRRCIVAAMQGGAFNRLNSDQDVATLRGYLIARQIMISETTRICADTTREGLPEASPPLAKGKPTGDPKVDAILRDYGLIE